MDYSPGTSVLIIIAVCACILWQGSAQDPDCYSEVITYKSPALVSGADYKWASLRIRPGVTSFRFRVKAEKDVHIGLSAEDMVLTNFYEIVIGGWDGQQSIIRQGSQTNFPDFTMQVDTDDVLVGDFLEFIISWAGGQIEVFKAGVIAPIVAYSHSTPFPVNYIGYYTGNNVPGEFAFCIHDCYLGSPSYTTDIVQLPYRWESLRIPSGVTNFKFKVRAGGDVHIGLSAADETLTRFYEIVIGGWGNSQSIIRQGSQTPFPDFLDEARVSTPDAVDNAFFREFVVSWAGGMIQVSEPGESTALVEYDHSLGPPFSVNYVGFSSGYGNWGVFSFCISDSELAACVSNLMVTTVSANAISLSWDATTGACPADSYRVTYEVSNADQCLATVDNPSPTTLDWQEANTVALENLIPYTTYKITVTGGLRELSDSSIITPGKSMEVNQTTNEDAAASGQPTDLVIGSKTDESTLFSWNEIPCGSRAGEIQSYSYQLTSNNQVVSTGSTLDKFIRIDYNALFDNMQCGLMMFQVAGKANAGTGEFSSINDEMVSTEPFVQGSSLTTNGITATTAAVVWSPPECKPSNYTVTYTLVDLEQCQPTNMQTVLADVSGSPVTLTGLEPGSSYVVAVSATTKNGVGRTLATEFKTGQSAPIGAPINLESTSGGNIGTFEWDELPCGSRNGVINAYLYQLFVNGNMFDSGQTPNRAFIMSDLPCGMVEFQVAGGNENGFSDNFASMQIQMLAPEPFQTGTALMTSSITSTSARISWISNECPPSPFMVSYTLTNLEQCTDVSVISQFSDTTETSVVLSDLHPGSAYRVTVSGKTSTGDTVSLETSLETIIDVPVARPENVRIITSDTSSITYAWDEVPCGSRGGALNYKAELLSTIDGPVIRSEETSSTIIKMSGLNSGLTYFFRVAAKNVAGQKLSEVVTSSTLVDIQELPFQLTLVEIDGQAPACLPQYADSNSAEYIAVSSRFSERMNSILGALNGYRAVRVNRIRCGSLIFDFDVLLDSTSGTTISDITSAIDGVAGTEGSIGDALKIAVEDPMSEGSSGTNTNTDGQTPTDIIIPIFAVIGLIIVLAASGLVIYYFWRRGRGVKSQNTTRNNRQISEVASPWGIHQRDIWNPTFDPGSGGMYM